MTTQNEVIEKLAYWLCVQKNYNWDYLNDFSRYQLKLEVMKLLHDIPELKIQE